MCTHRATHTGTQHLQAHPTGSIPRHSISYQASVPPHHAPCHAIAPVQIVGRGVSRGPLHGLVADIQHEIRRHVVLQKHRERAVDVREEPSVQRVVVQGGTTSPRRRVRGRHARWRQRCQTLIPRRLVRKHVHQYVVEADVRKSSDKVLQCWRCGVRFESQCEQPVHLQPHGQKRRTTVVPHESRVVGIQPQRSQGIATVLHGEAARAQIESDVAVCTRRHVMPQAGNVGGEAEAPAPGPISAPGCIEEGGHGEVGVVAGRRARHPRRDVDVERPRVLRGVGQHDIEHLVHIRPGIVFQPLHGTAAHGRTVVVREVVSPWGSRGLAPAVAEIDCGVWKRIVEASSLIEVTPMRGHTLAARGALALLMRAKSALDIVTRRWRRRGGCRMTRDALNHLLHQKRVPDNCVVCQFCDTHGL
eukprot:m.834877 g.834877  ORF g.834877 m.834877 type:complete len:417 (-) comp23452_c0_seq4:126-1376(-)